ncbi:hypothetical protein B0H67DRAFT_521349 [Lasiosphaeris hirsuta]|uniref:Uncharacterized protein n=1 Tax=Lasiosphaeris hirsuta TaxID=260670 RepID=A0AA39ZV54_9PEZI|nr:hypothetical protein B0H67DRAFT_521349 [Lasiosphaeris hirsuta]
MATNGTVQDQMVGWVSAPSQRSTWDIIWTCLSIFLLCSWRAVHLNLPTPEESLDEWNEFRLGSFGMVPYWPKKPLLVKWRRKVVWMGVICLAPEAGVGLAVNQYLAAREARDKANRAMPDDKFTMAHAFYANMGGITIRRVQPRTAQLGPGVEEKSSFEATDVVSGLDGLTDPDLLSTIQDVDIMDKSHSDVVTKLLAILQSTWLVFNSITRAARGLSISQLELATMAFIICALVMYGFWWHKPFNVERRHIVVKLARAGDNHDVAEICALSGRVPDFAIKRDLAHMIVPQAVRVEKSNDWAGDLAFAATYTTGLFFSAVHLAAWNWRFPSPLIQILWRWFATAALVTSLSPLYMVPLVMLTADARDRWAGSYFGWDTPAENITAVASLFMFAIYIISRLAVLALTFYCFRSMPVSTYEGVEWTAFIPHFGS